MSAHVGARIAGAVRAAPPLLILAAGGIALLVYAYPGQMSDDAFELLRQARGRFFDDRYPPALPALWRHLELFVAGPAAILLVQGAAFLLGAFAILRRALSPRAAAWATCALVVFPPILAPLAQISSHALMAALLAAGAGPLAWAYPGLQRAGLGALLVATAVQPSAAVATLPLVLVHWRPELDGRRRLLHAIVAWLAITVAAMGLDAFYAKQPAHPWHSTLAAFDLAGTLVRADAELGALDGTGFAGDRGAIRARYTPAEARPLVSGDDAPWAFPSDGTAPPAAQRDALARAARAVAGDHPGAYLAHRLAVMRELLWLGTRHPDAAVLDRELPAVALRFGIPTRSSELQDAWTSVLAALAAHTPLFVPWLYLAVALLLLPLARRHRDVLALLASGLAFEASLFVTATGAAYAPSLWPIASTCLAIVLLLARRVRR